MSYLNIDEVESALIVATSAPYTAFTQLITLPNLTWEGRQCHAIFSWWCPCSRMGKLRHPY
jgi:hypothetical protein